MLAQERESLYEQTRTFLGKVADIPGVDVGREGIIGGSISLFSPTEEDAAIDVMPA